MLWRILREVPNKVNERTLHSMARLLDNLDVELKLSV